MIHFIKKPGYKAYITDQSGQPKKYSRNHSHKNPDNDCQSLFVLIRHFQPSFGDMYEKASCIYNFSRIFDFVNDAFLCFR